MKTRLTFLFFLTFLVTASPQIGLLDLSFGDQGIVTTDFNLRGQNGRDVLLQPDGKIVVAGFAEIQKFSWPLDFDFALVRYHPDGSLDTAFGEGGLAGLGFATGPEGRPENDFGFAAALMPDGGILVTGISYFNGNLGEWTLARFLPDGSPDLDFGDQGALAIPIPSSNANGEDIAVQADGKYVLAGGAFNGNDNDVVLVRLTAGLGFDETFGENGIVTTDFGGSDEGAFAVAIQSDGKIVVTGFAENRIAVVRYLADGSLDAGFGEGGIVTTDLLGPEEKGFDLAVQPDGKIVVAGYVNRSPTCLGTECTPAFALVRYNPDGSLDQSFGVEDPPLEQGGVVWTAIGQYGARAFALALQPDGNIVSAGQMGLLGIGGPNGAFALTRHLPDGSRDSSFYGNSGGIPLPDHPGIVVTEVYTSAVDVVQALALQPDGKIVAAGSAGSDFAVARYLPGVTVSTQRLFLAVKNAVLYPNPASTESILEYDLEKNETLSIQLLDVHGRLIRTFADQEVRSPGRHRELLRLPSDLLPGIYTLAIRSRQGVLGMKMIER